MLLSFGQQQQKVGRHLLCLSQTIFSLGDILSLVACEKISSLVHTENPNAFHVQTTECSEQDDLFSPLSGLQKSLQTCRVYEKKEKLMGSINAYPQNKKPSSKFKILEALLLFCGNCWQRVCFVTHKGKDFRSLMTAMDFSSASSINR